MIINKRALIRGNDNHGVGPLGNARDGARNLDNGQSNKRPRVSVGRYSVSSGE